MVIYLTNNRKTYQPYSALTLPLSLSLSPPVNRSDYLLSKFYYLTFSINYRCRLGGGILAGSLQSERRTYSLDFRTLRVCDGVGGAGGGTGAPQHCLETC